MMGSAGPTGKGRAGAKRPPGEPSRTVRGRWRAYPQPSGLDRLHLAMRARHADQAVAARTAAAPD